MENDQLTVIDNATSDELEAMLTQGTEETSDETVEATETPAPEPEKPAEPAEKSEVEKRLEALEKRLKDKDDFINQRNAEIGILRKQLRDQKLAELGEEEEINRDELIDDPKAAIKKAVERAEKRKALEAERQNEMNTELMERNRQMVEQFLPNLGDVKPAIAEVLKADGAAEQLIAQFDADPANTFMAPVVFQLAKRAELQKKVSELEKKLAKYEENANRIVNNATKFSGAKSPVARTAPAPRASKKLDNLTEADIDRMSLEELQELQKEL